MSGLCLFWTISRFENSQIISTAANYGPTSADIFILHPNIHPTSVPNVTTRTNTKQQTCLTKFLKLLISLQKSMRQKHGGHDVRSPERADEVTEACHRLLPCLNRECSFIA